MAQAAGLSLLLSIEKPQCCISVWDLIKNELLIGKRRVEKSPASDRIQTHDLFVMRRVLYGSATTAAIGS